MATTLPPPPSRTTHPPTPIAPTTAESTLSAFLTRATSQPYLHPDSLLSSSGIDFPPASGPRGGLSLHHLRRIAQGIAGENLVPETREELRKFSGEDADDGAEIEESMGKDAGKNKKRKLEAIEDWADETASQGAEGPEVRNEADSPPPPGGAAGEGDYPGDWQEREEFERQQEIEVGEIDARDPEDGQLGGEPPKIVEHKDDGGAVTLTKAEKAARREEKKRKKLERRKEKGHQTSG